VNSSSIVERVKAEGMDNSPARRAVDHMLSTTSAVSEEVLERLHALSDEDLSHYGLRAYRMNLMALFGGRWSPRELAKKAREAAISKMWLGWEYHCRYLVQLRTVPESFQLRACPVDTIRDLLSAERGVVIASFHLGHMRHIPSDLAHAGIRVSMPLAEDSHANYESSRRGNPEAALWKNFDFINVEKRGGAIALARVLARGGCVFSTIDGNTGMDGSRGDDRRSIVSMLDTRVRVKNGLIAMAARFGTPVLPVIAVTEGGERVCRTLPVIDPGGALSGEVAARFVDSTLRTLYAWFADMLLEYGEEWCGGDLFHQWRVPEEGTQTPCEEVERQLTVALDQGASVQLDARRMLLLSDGDAPVYVDARTMKCYRFPAEERLLIDLLRDPSRGVDIDWFEHLETNRRARIWDFLCRMLAREVMTVRHGSAESVA
jgi:hypothetical protein